MLTLESFEEAAAKVKEVTQETKLIYSSYFSDMTGNKVYLKPENMQRTGAYKVRGAYYKISTLSDEERNKGLITASAGNHAQGVAWAASRLGIAATIVIPRDAPSIKVGPVRIGPDFEALAKLGRIGGRIGYRGGVAGVGVGLVGAF